MTPVIRRNTLILALVTLAFRTTLKSKTYKVKISYKTSGYTAICSFSLCLITWTPQEEKRRRDEVAKKKADVRKRLEETSAKKAKKGFMTPERKKKLRVRKAYRVL